ncbi:MAG: hypothetical protein MUO54_14810 [Anaerolineales bacterium]|nr:hypothetical protein [Anaerolineales bacterium]
MFRITYTECKDYQNELIKKAEIERLVKRYVKKHMGKANLLRVVEGLSQPRIEASWNIG